MVTMALLTVVLMLGTRFGQALYADDAGQLDFLVATTGHGPADAAFVSKEGILVTSSSNSCYLAARSVTTGALLWRRNVCSSISSTATAIALGSDALVTSVDGSGAVRAWNVSSGRLEWDSVLSTTCDIPRAGLVDQGVAVSCDKVGAVLELNSGQKVGDAPRKIPSYNPSAHCAAQNLMLKAEGSQLMQWQSKDGGKDQLVGTPWEATSETDAISLVTMASCSSSGATAIVSTVRGTTSYISIDLNHKITTGWSAEDGLASVTVGSLVDASHEFSTGDASENLLSFSNRLSLQIEAIKSLLTTDRSDRRNSLFGFVKIAILLSSVSHRVWALDTVAREIKYQIDLPSGAQWHRLVHGGTTSAGHHGDHGDYLALSSLQGNVLSWTCWDGPSGVTLESGQVVMGSPVIQVVPVDLEAGTCRQGAIVVGEDHTTYAIPAQLVTQDLYTHAIAGDNTLNTLLTSSEAFSSYVVGTTVFDGEEIVSMAYPTRSETVQSPVTVLGDDSLLLKYLNPHLAVVFTRKTTAEDGKGDALVDAMYPTKRKPLGATDETQTETTETSQQEEARPNLFVNLVDTVSGRVLHRVSHAHAADFPTPKAVISENWIFYTYGNTKTRRSELGVLSLFEGMINSKGITAFSSPEQSTTFSSLNARDSKPIVLSKVYSLGQSATAIGITTTRSGISNRRIVLATLDGQITMVDRKVLDPRRPMGKAKETEKKEGLQQYSEFVPIVPFMTLSYNQTVEGAHTVLSAPTDLESQSLLLAFGGPDIFFARTSPARGFDLLPDSFNRPLLSLVVGVLLATVFILKRMAASKMKNQCWT